ncbi:MAG: MATE family efflux transporter, partial [Flavobacterium sp.]|nr:MATE family efflux transporter [Flavobacterium sp.]
VFVSLMEFIVHQTLFFYGGEHGVTVYVIINRMLMFAYFPILGITQGFLPIAGYNYGAKNFHRVKESIIKSIIAAAVMASCIFGIIYFFAEPIVRVFTTDVDILKITPQALIFVFAATPIIALQLIGAAYFQAVGKAFPALLLTLTKQGFFLIPLVLLLPKYFGIHGVWIAFPIADLLSTLVTAYFLNREIKTKLIEY